MAFCGNCGAQLEDGVRFCPKCGHQLNAAGAAASAPAATAAPAAAPPVATFPTAPPAYPPPPAQPVASPFTAQPMAPPPVAQYPQYYPPPGQIPIVTMPQEAPKHHGWLWGVIVVVGILGGLYYIGTHDQDQTQPKTGPQAKGPTATLAQQQVFTSSWRLANGDVQLYNQQWKNGSNVAIQSSDLECDQNDQNGSVLYQQHITLTKQTGGTVGPGSTLTFDPLDIGKAEQGLSKVNCAIVGVTAAQ